MNERRVVVAPEAAEDLATILDWVAGEATPGVALDYLSRVEAFVQRLGAVPELGRSRADIRAGLRVVHFERRLLLAFAVEEDKVTLLRVFGAGRDWEASF